jgi:hypothetical protein
MAVQHDVRDKDHNLKDWFKKHWYDHYPLFDTNLQVMYQAKPSTTDRKLHTCQPIYQMEAHYVKRCFEIIRYLRVLTGIDEKKWETFIKAFLSSWTQLKCSFRWSHQTRPLREPAAKEYEDRVESTMDVVIALILHGSKQHPADWHIAVKQLALKIRREARQMIEGLLKDRFAEVEEEHLRKSGM